MTWTMNMFHSMVYNYYVYYRQGLNYRVIYDRFIHIYMTTTLRPLSRWRTNTMRPSPDDDDFVE